MNTIQVTGVNHQKTPLAVRERLALDESSTRQALHFLISQSKIHEAVILSTCNRTELYVVCRQDIEPNGHISELILEHINYIDDTIKQYFYTYHGAKAIQHLFRVSAGLDSMVLGEDQILNQVKRAYSMATEEKTARRTFHKLFHQAFRVGKRSRNETGISTGSASVASVAVELTQKIFTSLSDKNIVFVGAGEIAQNALLNVQKHGGSHITVLNRTRERAESLARQYNATFGDLADLPNALVTADVVITSTSARNYILTSAQVAELMRQRKGKALFLIDLAVPRDVQQSVRDIYNVYLYDIDDLQNIVDRHLKERQHDIPLVEKIIKEELNNFRDWLTNNEALPTIRELHQHMELLRQQEVDKNRKRFQEEDWGQLEKFSKSLLKKFLHHPMTRLNACQNVDDLCGRCTVREVFGLEDDE